MQYLLVVAVIIALLSVVFALQNSIVIGVNFLVWSFTGSLAFFLLVTLALGVIVGFLFSIPAIAKRRWKILSGNRKISSLEKTIQEQRQDLEDREKRIRYLERTLEGDRTEDKS